MGKRKQVRGICSEEKEGQHCPGLVGKGFHANVTLSKDWGK